MQCFFRPAKEAAPAEDAANSGAPTKDAVPVSAAAATPQGAAEVPPTTWPQPSAQEAPSAGRRWSAKRIVGVCAIALVVVVAIAAVAMNMNQTQANLIPSEGFEKDEQVDADVSAVGNAPAATDDSAATGVTAGISTDDVARAHAALKLAETGWSIDANGYISYAFALENTSDDLLVDFPAVTITGYDDAGSVVSSDTMTLAALISIVSEIPAYDPDDYAQRFIAQGYLYMFLGLLVRENGGNHFRYSPAVADALDCIHTHYGEPLSVADVAARVNVSRATLYRAFVRECGCSPGEYLVGYRLKASVAAFGTDKSLAEIAYDCGFGSYAHYADIFRTQYGVSPSVYRKRQAAGGK